jgi:hypothetical protein
MYIKNKYLSCLANRQSDTKINRQSGGNTHKNSNKGASKESITPRGKTQRGEGKNEVSKVAMGEKGRGWGKVKGGWSGAVWGIMTEGFNQVHGASKYKQL